MAIDELAPGSSHEPQARAAAWAGGAGSGGRGGARPQGERMTILGIDPGKSGAVAVLDEGGELLKVHDTPSTLEPNGRSATNAPLLMSERERLPDRRGAELIDFEHGGRKWTLTVGRFADGRVGEVFLDTPKASAIGEIAADAAIAASVAFQHGAPLSLQTAGRARWVRRWR